MYVGSYLTSVLACCGEESDVGDILKMGMYHTV